MHVALVAHIPNEFVFGCVKDAVQRNRQFDHAKIWPEVPAIPGQARDHLLPDLFGQPEQLVDSQLLDLRRTLNRFEIVAHTCSGSWGDNGFNVISPPAFLSSCWIFTSASASLS